MLSRVEHEKVLYPRDQLYLPSLLSILHSIFRLANVNTRNPKEVRRAQVTSI